MNRVGRNRREVVVIAEAARRVELGAAEEAAVAAAFICNIFVFEVHHNRVSHEHRIVEKAVDLVRSDVGVGDGRVDARVGRDVGLTADLRRGRAALGRLAAPALSAGRRRLPRRRVGAAFFRRRGGDAGADDAENDHQKRQNVKGCVFHCVRPKRPLLRRLPSSLPELAQAAASYGRTRRGNFPFLIIPMRPHYVNRKR